MVRKKIVVLGYYFKDNFGDNLFIDAFKYLFPTFDFTFVNKITLEHLQHIDAVFIGGGSLLDGSPSVIEHAWEKLKQQQIFYIGVGTETNIHPKHLELMKLAKLIASRSNQNINKIKEINEHVIVIPDLAYCLPSSISDIKIKNSICIIPNMLVVPKWNDPQWKHSAWQHFKTEFSQSLDELTEKYTINFLPMCVNEYFNDQHAAIEIINYMSRRRHKYLLNQPKNIKEVTQLLSQYDIVITQRYHGIVLANMSNVPCITIHHHEKLKNEAELGISYYGLYKQALFDQINQALEMKDRKIMPIDTDIVNKLVATITSIIN